MVRVAWLLALLFIVTPTAAHAQPWSGILHPSRAVDWSAGNAGVVGGVPTRTTICSTLNPGATAAQINSAISSCPSGQVVFLNAGTYNLAGEIVMKSNVTLRGAGPDQTQLVFSTGGGTCSLAGLEDVCFTGSFNWSGTPQHLTTWTAGYSVGTTQITLGNTAGLSVGQLLILDQANDAGDTGQVFVNDTTQFSTEGGSPGRIVGGVHYSQQEYKRVTGINGNVVTITPGLYMPNWNAGKSPSAWWATTLIQQAGIEALTLNHSSSNNLTGVAFFNAYNCWMQNVRSIYATNSNGGGRNHVWFQYSARITVRDSYFYGTRDAATLSYGVEPWQSGDLLVENNIFQHIVAPLLIGNTHGSIFAYNYSRDHYFAANLNWNMPGPSFTHDAGTAMNLFEGNQGTGMVEDNIHGTHNFHTYFRNQWSGRDPGRTQQSVVSELAAYSRYMNVIGNVMGEAGYHNNYQDIEPTTTNCNTSIYIIGFQSLCAGTADSLVATTLMRWGNYDTVNNAVRFVSAEVPSGISPFANPVPASQALPASFYLAAPPSAWWATPWGTPPWPAVGPDVTGGTVTSGSGAASTLGGHAYKIPARLCYENLAKDVNGVLIFNALNCYTPQSVSAPTAPSNLQVQ